MKTKSPPRTGGFQGKVGMAQCAVEPTTLRAKNIEPGQAVSSENWGEKQ
jgi:hypothetical protein